jgi:histidinol-phosphatase
LTEESLESDLALAHELADAADRITTSRFRAHDLAVETKPDLTPVTEADRAAEQALSIRLGEARPGDGIVGEEFGETGGGARRWILDPIDGTKNYVRGVPVWATLIGLEVGGELVAGVVSAPALGRRWWAARGSGAFANGDPIHASRVRTLADAQLCYSDTSGWDEFGRGAEFGALMRRCWRTRGFGDFWGHMLVAEGAADVMAEPVLALWDVAALRPIVEEAGGRLTDLTGAGWATGAPAVTTNGLLHADVLTALGPPDAATGGTA